MYFNIFTQWLDHFFDVLCVNSGPLDMESIMNYKSHSFHSLCVESDLKLAYVDIVKTVNGNNFQIH